MPRFTQDDLTQTKPHYDAKRFTGVVRYVSQSGAASNSGLSPVDALDTISAAIAAFGIQEPTIVSPMIALASKLRRGLRAAPATTPRTQTTEPFRFASS